MMHSSVRGFLLSWRSSPVGRKKEKSLERLLYHACFGPYGGKEIGNISITMNVWIKQLRVLSRIFIGSG